MKNNLIILGDEGEITTFLLNSNDRKKEVLHIFSYFFDDILQHKSVRNELMSKNAIDNLFNYEKISLEDFDITIYLAETMTLEDIKY